MSALNSIRIKNYRCFADHTVDFRRTTIIVGRNNAGKSTLIEAIRLVTLALRRFQNTVAFSPPEWLDDHAIGAGQRIDLARLGVWPATLFHRYGDPPAVIEARFDDGSQLGLYVGPEGEGHAIFAASDGSFVRRRHDLRHLRLPTIAILPQVTPVEREERVLNSEYVRQNMDSHLASRHFRNQLNLLYDSNFAVFRNLVEESWPGVRVEELVGRNGEQSGPLQLMIRDGNFVAEVGWMGHGLQMWLQTVWFITRSATSGTVVLDEPDVYMHPDLQRRLVRFLRRQTTELIVATHSTEILAEVDATSVLVLDRERNKSTFATDVPAVQRIVESIGSAQNLQIARLWRSKVLVMVEGNDMKVLKRVHDLVCPERAPIDAYPNWSIGGWSGWPNALGSAAALKTSVHQDIRCFCIFDSDYHLDKEKKQRYKKASEESVELHILEKKEIENYLIVPRLIVRVIERSIETSLDPPSESQVRAKIDEISKELSYEAQDCFAAEFNAIDRAAGIKVASDLARKYVHRRALEVGLDSIVSGKDLMTGMSKWSQSKFGVSFGVATLLRNMRRDDVANELADLVSRISNAAR